MSWVSFCTFNGASLDTERVFGDLNDAEVTCGVARARLAKFLQKPRMMILIAAVDGDVEREVKDTEIIKLCLGRNLTSPMTETDNSHLVMPKYRVVIVGMGRLFPKHYEALQEMGTDEALEYWSMIILKQELFDVFMEDRIGGACPSENAVALAACAPPQLLRVHLDDILKQKWSEIHSENHYQGWKISTFLSGGQRHSDEVCMCTHSGTVACDHLEGLVDKVLANDLEGFGATAASALCKHLAALSLFANETSEQERAQICSLSALVQDRLIDVFDQCCLALPITCTRGIIFYNMHVCLFHEARACWAKRGSSFPRSSLNEQMMNRIQQLLQDPENDYWEAADFENCEDGWGYALTYAKDHDDDNVQEALPLSYARMTTLDNGPCSHLLSAVSTALNCSQRVSNRWGHFEDDMEAQLHETWRGTTMEVYVCPTTLRTWFWHPESRFHGFEDELRNQGWERYIDGIGQHWWWNPAIQDWFFERPVIVV